MSDELGAFLRARRAELNPRDVGLPHDDAGRRVPGLRREEVAGLAAISVSGGPVPRSPAPRVCGIR